MPCIQYSTHHQTSPFMISFLSYVTQACLPLTKPNKTGTVPNLMNQSVLSCIFPYCVLSVLITSTDISMVHVTLSLSGNEFWVPTNP